MDGLLGLKKIGELHPDVVTLDLEMPRMDAWKCSGRSCGDITSLSSSSAATNEMGAYSALNALALGAI